MTQEKIELYKKAIKIFGQEAQLKMAIEEMAELTKAICKLFRKNGENERVAIYEEIADVEIMIEQLRVLFGQTKIDLRKEGKIRRLEKLLSEQVTCEDI